MRTNYIKELYDLFCRKTVLKLSTIMSAFPGRSRMSIHRDFKKIDAISSYNNRGGFYTLRELAQFNEHGVWKYGDALFSAYGSLKQTICTLINRSKKGMTHNELLEVLQLRTHGTLLELVKENAIIREESRETFVYVSAEPEIRQNQLSIMPEPFNSEAELRMVINVLSMIIKKPEATISDVCREYKDAGYTQMAVEKIFERYVQGKKN